MAADKQAERYRRILEASSQLIVRYGYDKTTMDDIAREAGISKGAIYLHFRSKEALLDALVIAESRKLLDDMLARIDADPEGMTVFNMYRYAVLAMLENPLMKALYLRDNTVFGDYVRRIRKGRIADPTTIGVEFVRHFQAAGLIKPEADPAMVAAIMVAIRFGMLNLTDLMPGTPPLEDITIQVGAMLQATYGTEHGNSEAGKAALRTMFNAAMELMNTLADTSGTNLENRSGVE